MFTHDFRGIGRVKYANRIGDVDVIDLQRRAPICNHWLYDDLRVLLFDKNSTIFFKILATLSSSYHHYFLTATVKDTQDQPVIVKLFLTQSITSKIANIG